MGGGRDFNDLPEDMQNEIWGFINAQSNTKELANWSLVSKSWNAFFKEKLTDLHLLFFLTKDTEACKKISLDDLVTSINIYLRHHKDQKDKIADLFIALQILNTNLIAIENSEDKSALKFNKHDLEKVLIEKFGLIDLINQTMMEGAFSDALNISEILPFCALQKLLQRDPIKYAGDLAFLNLCAEKRLFTLHFEDHPVDTTIFKMMNNQLNIELTFAGQTDSLSISITDHLSANEVNLSDLDEPINALLARLETVSSKSVLNSKLRDL